MKKRFTHLVAKYLDFELNKKEKAKLDKFLLDPTCSEYLKKAEIAHKLLVEEVERDIIMYGGKKDPETVAAVKRMHENMLKHNRKIRRRIFGSVAAVILIGIAIVYLLTSMTSP